MRIKFLGAAALVAALGVILLPGAALPVAEIHENEGLADYDSRTGKIAPTSAQRAHARRLVGNAHVRWNRFGTPSSIVRHGKFLARGIRGRNAAVAARWYLNRHRALFGLQSLDGLVLESSNRLVGSNGYAVNFRQVFRAYRRVRWARHRRGCREKARGWRVAHVSSSLTCATTLAGIVTLSAADGWARAARASRMTRSVVNILTRKRMGGVTRLRVAGLDSPQTVQLVAFPTVREGLLPAYEALVVDGKAGKAYPVLRRRTERTLARTAEPRSQRRVGLEALGCDRDALQRDAARRRRRLRNASSRSPSAPGVRAAQRIRHLDQPGYGSRPRAASGSARRMCC